MVVSVARRRRRDPEEWEDFEWPEVPRWAVLEFPAWFPGHEHKGRE